MSMFALYGLLALLVWAVVAYATRERRAHHRVLRQNQARNNAGGWELDRLLRELESSARQEMAPVRGGQSQREHVWCAPGGHEVFLN